MSFNIYLDHLKEKLQSSYDVFEESCLDNINFQLHARYFLRTERYIASKKAVVFGIENNDYIFVKHLPQLNQEDLNFYLTWIDRNLEVIVKPHSEHMSSTLTLGLILDDEVNEELVESIIKAKIHRSYAWGFKGWADLRLVVYSLRDGAIFTNKKGREVKGLFSH